MSASELWRRLFHGVLVDLTRTKSIPDVVRDQTMLRDVQERQHAARQRIKALEAERDQWRGRPADRGGE